MKKHLTEFMSWDRFKLSKLFLNLCMMLLLFMLAIPQLLAQDSRTVTGTVVDLDGQPIPSATIVVKGTTVGDITAVDGTYSIEVPEGAEALIISFVGMTSMEVQIGSQTVIDVVLEEDTYGLEEVVVVGYGTQKKASLSGAIAQVKGEDVIQGKGVSNSALALQGEIPGLTITRSSARPGNEEVEFLIRGAISVNDIKPAIILDGVEISEEAFQVLNPNDIESVSVLKDGSASIYGTRAAGGVIMITTKRGQRNQPMRISYTGEYQITYINKKLPLCNAQEWAEMFLHVGNMDVIPYVNDAGETVTPDPTYRFFTEEEFNMIIDETLPEYYFFNNKWHHMAWTNQFDEVYGAQPSHRHNVSISGGTEKARFMSSIGFANDQFVNKHVYDGTKRYNVRTNVDYDVNDVVKTQFNLSYETRIIDVPTQGEGEGVQDAYLFPLYNPQGQYYDIFGGNNLLAKLDEGGRTVTDYNIARLGGKLIIDLDKYVKGLSFDYKGDLNISNSDKTARKSTVTMYDWEGNISFQKTTLATSTIQVDQTNGLAQTHQMLGHYNRMFGENTIGITAGMIAEQYQQDTYQMYRKGMLSDDLDALDTGDATTQTNEGGGYAVGQVSYIARFNYDYQGTYLLELLGRRDGSSRLHPDYRWANFGGASAAVRISEMGFMQNVDALDNLKLRVGYGETGSVVGIGNYDYLSAIATGTTIFGVVPAYANIAYIDGMSTEDRTWERISKTNIGVDFGLLRNRLAGSFDYFINKNNGMLIGITYPSILGADAPETNSGDFTTKGWEATLNWRERRGDFNYQIGVWMADARSEVTRMEGATSISRGVNQAIEGYPLNSIWVYRTDGFLEDDAAVYSYYEDYGFDMDAGNESMKSGTIVPTYRSDDRLAPGCVRRLDTNDDGVISMDDLDYYGDAMPHYTYGINLSLEWKGIDFRAFFQGVGQQYMIRDGAMEWPWSKWWRNQNNTYLGNTWSPETPDADFPRVSMTGSRKNWNYGHVNDITVVDVSYVRAKVISLGYTLPSDIMNKAGIDRLRVYVSGNDLFAISNVKDGLDPEKASSVGQGSSDPYTGAVIFGIDVTF